MRKRLAGWVAGLGLLGLIVGACGLDKPEPPKPDDEFGAAALGDLQPGSSILELLDPEEREALDKSGMSMPKGEQTESATALSRDETKSDKAGAIGISVLGVAITAAMVAAPFFMF
jgi:hypothetical protein